MIVVAEIALFILGLCALVTGKLKVGKDRIVSGAAARWLGLVGMLPMPLAFCIGAFLGAQMAARGLDPLDRGNYWSYTVVEGGTVLFCLVVVFGLGSKFAESLNPSGHSRRPEGDAESGSPDQFGDNPAPTDAYQGTVPLQSVALAGSHHPTPAEAASSPKQSRALLPTWLTLVLIAVLAVVAIMFVKS